jgi:hypothetical protein
MRCRVCAGGSGANRRAFRNPRKQGDTAMATGDPVILGQNNTADRTTLVRRTTPGIGLQGEGREGVMGLGRTGLHGQGIGLPGQARGVLGEAEDGIGVEALGQGFGIGVWAMGGRAPLFLKPSAKVGPPTTGEHARGELMVDRKGDLYLCKKPGTPGFWKLIG